MRFDLFIDDAAAEQEQVQIEQVTSRLRAALADALHQPLGEGICNLVVIGQDSALELNRTFRGKDYVPDVLSFPLEPQPGEDTVIGEVYICWTMVLAQAQEYNHSWQRECAWLMTHGILHLLGYDHGEEPSPEMRRLEENVLERLNLRR